MTRNGKSALSLPNVEYKDASGDPSGALKHLPYQQLGCTIAIRSKYPTEVISPVERGHIYKNEALHIATMKDITVELSGVAILSSRRAVKRRPK